MAGVKQFDIAQFSALFDEFDADDSGHISWKEFVAAVTE